MRGCCIRDWNETSEFLRCWICKSEEFAICRELLFFSHTVLYLYCLMICQEETGKGGIGGEFNIFEEGEFHREGALHCIVVNTFKRSST